MPYPKPAFTCGRQLRVRVADGAGDHDGVHARQVRRIVADMGWDTFGTQGAQS